MQVEDGDVDEVEELRVVLDRVARREEHDHLVRVRVRVRVGVRVRVRVRRMVVSWVGSGQG